VTTGTILQVVQRTGKALKAAHLAALLRKQGMSACCFLPGQYRKRYLVQFFATVTCVNTVLAAWHWGTGWVTVCKLELNIRRFFAFEPTDQTGKTPKHCGGVFATLKSQLMGWARCIKLWLKAYAWRLWACKQPNQSTVRDCSQMLKGLRPLWKWLRKSCSNVEHNVKRSQGVKARYFTAHGAFYLDIGKFKIDLIFG